MEKETANRIIGRLYKFGKMESAKRFADNCNGVMMVVLGDDGKFWVGVSRDTEALVKAGYEYAN